MDAETIGDGLHRLPIPIPFEVGPVNCYLLESDDGPILIDTGPKTDAARALLYDGLRTVGVAPQHLRHLVITHSHIDHHGLVGRLSKASGATVHLHEEGVEEVVHFTRGVERNTPIYREIAEGWGYGPSALMGLAGFRTLFTRLADDLDPAAVQPLTGPVGALELGGRTLHYLHCPGHTRDLVCLHLPDHGVLLTSDHLLESITPNPSLYVPRYRGWRTGLRDYLASLSRLVEQMPEDVRLAPGHGPLFGDLRQRVAAIHVHHEERKERILALLAEAYPRTGPSWLRHPETAPGWTVAAIATRLWEKLTPGDFYLACKEVHSHLDLLAAEEEVQDTWEGPLRVWSLKGMP